MIKTMKVHLLLAYIFSHLQLFRHPVLFPGKFVFQVRGAPLIAVVGTMGILIEILDKKFDSVDVMLKFYEDQV